MRSYVPKNQNSNLRPQWLPRQTNMSLPPVPSFVRPQPTQDLIYDSVLPETHSKGTFSSTKPISPTKPTSPTKPPSDLLTLRNENTNRSLYNQDPIPIKITSNRNSLVFNMRAKFESNAANETPHSFTNHRQVQKVSPFVYAMPENDYDTICLPDFVKKPPLPSPVLLPTTKVPFSTNRRNIPTMNKRPLPSPVASSMKDLKSVGTTFKYDLKSRLNCEPLYQIYDQVIDELKKSMKMYDSTDGSQSSNYIASGQLQALPVVKQIGLLWREVPEVIDSTILDTMTDRQKNLMEAKFEVVTSEASYLKSMNILCNHFIANLSTRELLLEDQKDVLFGNIEPIRQVSESFFDELMLSWNRNFMLPDLCDIINVYSETQFSIYMTCYENQLNMDRTLKHLRETNGSFEHVLQELQSNPECKSQSLRSFLILPKQRISRLSQLVETIFMYLDSDDHEYKSCQNAIKTLKKIEIECMESVHRTQRLDECNYMWQMLDFPVDVKPPMPEPNIERKFELFSAAYEITIKIDSKNTVKKCKKNDVFLFLFTDLFVVATKSTNWSYYVVHCCPRRLVQVKKDTSVVFNSKNMVQHPLIVSMLETQEQSRVELFLDLINEINQESWFEALNPVQSLNPNEIIYSEWDCPKVIACHAFVPDREEDLPIQPGDIMLVTRKIDGWNYGKRESDSLEGWFPDTFVVEVASEHLRAKNIKQRETTLKRSKSFIQKKNS